MIVHVYMQGFEFNPEQWFPYKDFKNCTALTEWEMLKKARTT